MKKIDVAEHFDHIAESYDLGKEKYNFYYSSLKKLLKGLIGKNKNIFEFGCGTGDLLASLNPRKGYGYDISPKMIALARKKYLKNKNLRFFNKLLIANRYHLSTIFMSDVVEHLENPQKEFLKIAKFMNSETRFIITMANPIWEPLLMFWEKMGWKMTEGPHKRIRHKDIKILSNNSGMRIIKHDYKLLIPIEIPFITNFANKYLEKYLNKIAFIEYFVIVKA